MESVTHWTVVHNILEKELRSFQLLTLQARLQIMAMFLLVILCWKKSYRQTDDHAYTCNRPTTSSSGIISSTSSNAIVKDSNLGTKPAKCNQL